MPRNRYIARAAATSAVVGTGAVLFAGTASAHVEAEPIGQAVKGDYAEISFRVPNEQDTAGTVALKVTFPLEHPLSSARTKPMPGWTAQVQMVKLPRPVQENGATVTDAVASITWTAQPGTRIGPGEFTEFQALAGPMPSDVDKVVLPAEQTYDNGQVVQWDAPPAAPGAPEPEHPAPTLDLSADESGQAHGSSHGSGGDSDAPAQTAGSAKGESDDTARLLGGAGLAVGALGLGFGAGALARGRSRRS